MDFLAFSSGIGMDISRSILPFLLIIGSIESGRLVVPITTTNLPDIMSKQLANCETRRLSISLLLPSLFGVTMSISSMRIIHGAISIALSNNFLKVASEFPDTPLIKLGPESLK
ncbi:cell division control protein 48 [Cryptosporidium felis]|nr:cell division control protein 48 [Cryptosporidium felis]